MADAQHEPPIPTLQIRLFGPIEVRVEGAPIPPLRRHKILWLLALLILRHERQVGRAWLAETLWPDSDPTRALFNLRQSLPLLRQALGPAGDRLGSPTAKTLALDLTGAEVDLLDFDAAVGQSDLASLERVVSLYQGPLLEGCMEEWALSERQGREQGCLNALERLADAALASGQSGSSVGYLRRVIGMDPLRESAHRGLMQAYAHNGDYASAVQVYRELRVVLQDGLQAQPDAQTKALHERLRQEAKERVSVNVGSRQTLPASEEGTRPAANAPLTNLPVRLTSFIGRLAEITELMSLLQPQGTSRSPVVANEIEVTSSSASVARLGSWSPAARLVTLMGSGGCGKTRLACEVGVRLLEDYPDGVWLVELAALTEGALVCQAIATVLGLREEPGRSLQTVLIEHLKSRRLLLLLDNCEHLLNDCARLIGSVLPQCPGLTVLTTSRSPLEVEGEIVSRVPSLPTPDPQELQAEKDVWGLVMDYDACRLFVERARGHCADLELGRSSAVSVARICQRLDGIPLAIELAAARVRSLSVEEIEARLDQRFRLLTGRSRTALPRHQTLQALIDWSWDLLDSQERLLLARLSVFTGGWTLEAAENVCSDNVCSDHEEVLDLLSSLVDKSLVIAETQAGCTRYRLLETVRQYARDRLAESEKSRTLGERHRDYFLQRAEEARTKLQGSEQAHWLEVLEQEYDNLRAAISFCLQDPEGGAKSLRLGVAVQGFWMTRGYFSEGRECLAALLRHSSVSSHSDTEECGIWNNYLSLRANVLNNAGLLASAQGDYAAANSLYEDSLTLCRELGRRDWQAGCLFNIGNVARLQGDGSTARSLYEESRAIFRELGDHSAEASILNSLAAVAYHHGDYASSRSLQEESLTIYRELGNRSGIALGLGNAGNAAHIQGDYASARRLFEESLAIQRELGDRSGIAQGFAQIGNVAFRQGDYATARSLHEESLAIRRELGTRLGIANSLYNLGMVIQCQGEVATACSLLEESLAIQRELGVLWGIASALNGLGRAALRQGDYASARSRHEESLTIRRELGDRWGIACSLEALAALALDENASERATRLCGAASALREEIGSPKPPNEREDYDKEVATLRETLGEAAFTSAWEEGRTMTTEAAVAHALGESRTRSDDRTGR